MNKIKDNLLPLLLLISGVFLIFYIVNNYTGGEDPHTYMTGVLVRSPASGCGLVRVLQMDLRACKLAESFCDEHSDLLNERLRISGIAVDCSQGGQIRCSRIGDFYDATFRHSECFVEPKVVKVFKE